MGLSVGLNGAGMKNKLTAISVKNAPDGTHLDGGGLMLSKAGISGKWIYRYQRLGKRRDMGLGQWPAVSLAEARKLRDQWAAELSAGRDPIAARKAHREAEVAARDRSDPTFAELTAAVFEARKATLREAGKRGRWLSPLVKHVHPRIGRQRVSQLTRHDYADALRPIWRTKFPTAEKAYQRMLIVVREGKFMGYPCDPFEVEAAKRILGEVRHIAVPIPSTPWQDVPGLYARLGNSISDDCLRFTILTCVRADASTRARLCEFDGDVWTVPEMRVKGREGAVRDFRVPLSAEAMKIVDRARARTTDYLFSAIRGRPVTSASIEKRLNTMGEAGRPHGFRTSFRTWVQDTDACPWEVSETVLGHAVGNKIERSYARSDLLERRRVVMDAWAAYVTGAASNIVVLEPQRAG